MRLGLNALHWNDKERSKSPWVVAVSGDVRGSRLLAQAQSVSAGFQECTSKRGLGKSGSPPRFPTASASSRGRGKAALHDPLPFPNIPPEIAAIEFNHAGGIVGLSARA